MIIDLKDSRYPVLFESESLSNTVRELINSKENFLVIIDEAVYESTVKICPQIADINEMQIMQIAARKESKTAFSLMKILSRLEAVNFPRSGTIIAIGGGVIGDVCGLAASLWYRGCNLIHVPTTLLAAVDSCVGGKTALNFGNTINAIGTYYHPTKIIISSELLKCLPEREISSGMAEVIKYTIIGNSELLNLINDIEFSDLRNDKILQSIIELSLKQKALYVTDDIQEAGKRLFLNLGHTIGHALEISSIYNGQEQLRHGEGVALGLIAISHISQKLRKLDQSALDRIYKLVEKFKLPTYLKPSSNFDFDHAKFTEKCVAASFRDKKRTKSNLRLILPIANAEKCEIYESSSYELIKYGVRAVVREF